MSKGKSTKAVKEDKMNRRPREEFWDDFTIADHFGVLAIEDTFKRAFKEWKHDYIYIYLTELVMVLNHKIWRYYGKNRAYANLYTKLFDKADAYAVNHLKGEKLKYYLRTTD